MIFVFYFTNYLNFALIARSMVQDQKNKKLQNLNSTVKKIITYFSHNSTVFNLGKIPKKGEPEYVRYIRYKAIQLENSCCPVSLWNYVETCRRRHRKQRASRLSYHLPQFSTTSCSIARSQPLLYKIRPTVGGKNRLAQWNQRPTTQILPPL